MSAHGKDVRNLLGGLTRPRFIEGKAPDSGEIQAVLQLIEPDGDTAVKMREAYARGLSGLFGFSIDCSGSAETAMREGQRVRGPAHRPREQCGPDRGAGRRRRADPTR